MDDKNLDNEIKLQSGIFNSYLFFVCAYNIWLDALSCTLMY